MAAPLINGVEYSWASVSVNIFGKTVKGITAVSYSEAQEIEPNYGAGVEPVSASDGNVAYTGSVELHKTEVEALTALSPTGKLQDLGFFPIAITYNSGSKVANHVLQACRFKGNTRQLTQNQKGITVSLELFVGAIKWK